jgi:hypothetical protein
MSDEFVVPPVALYDTICRTPGCPNEGITLRSWGDAASPIVLCAPCGQFVTEIYPAPTNP